MQKARAEDDALDAEMKLAAEKAAKELQERRDARKVPAEGDFDGLMDFLMDSEEGELEYEMVRCRPLITEDFLKFLQAEVSTRKLSATDDVQQGIAAELEGMLEVLKASAQKVDEDVRILVEPAERMRELLQSKVRSTRLKDANSPPETKARAALLTHATTTVWQDKKAHILQMVENNEIDQPLIDLMSQNIHGAREAGQEEAAEFMSKINDALKRYLPSGAA